MASVLLLDVEPARLRLHTQTQRAKRLAGNLSLPWSPRPGATCATLISLLLDALTLGGAGTSYGVAQRKIGSPGLPEKNMACKKHGASFLVAVPYRLLWTASDPPYHPYFYGLHDVSHACIKGT